MRTKYEEEYAEDVNTFTYVSEDYWLEHGGWVLQDYED